MRDRLLHPDFPDYFSADAAGYAAFRPRYPEALFDWLRDQVAAHRLAWDAGTGSGQAAAALAARFARVVATDASPQQLANASQHPNIEYRLGVSGASGLEPASVDLATVAQALHWFDRDEYFAEVERVLVPGGMLAVWCYSGLRLGDRLTQVVEQFSRATLGPWWTADRQLVDEGYRSIALPFRELAVPEFEMRVRWTLRHLLGYVGTWSAVRRYREGTGEDPVPGLARALGTHWGDPDRPRLIRWPLHLRATRRDSGNL